MAKRAETRGFSIELILPAELFAQLGRIAEASGLRDATEAAIVEFRLTGGGPFGQPNYQSPATSLPSICQPLSLAR